MVISLADYERVQAGDAEVTGHCRWCGVDVVDSRTACLSCEKAPARITVGNDRWEGGVYVDEIIPDTGEFEYVRADLVEKMKDTDKEQ